MNSIHFFTNNTAPQLHHSDERLAHACRTRGLTVHATPWEEDRNFDTPGIIRSTWNYPSHAEAFVEWMDKRSRQSGFVHSQDLMRWNMEKTYLCDLLDMGFPVIPTYSALNITELSWDDAVQFANSDTVVIKPRVGIDAVGVTRVHSKKEYEKISTTQPVIVQPFCDGVLGGEYSLTFLGDEHLHTTVRIPKAGDFRANVAHGARVLSGHVGSSAVEMAREVVRALPEEPFYARVDLIAQDGEFLIMEVELIEPGFFFYCAPEKSVDIFADRLLSYLRV